jgi:fused signal recognition particle receptor
MIHDLHLQGIQSLSLIISGVTLLAVAGGFLFFKKKKKPVLGTPLPKVEIKPVSRRTTVQDLLVKTQESFTAKLDDLILRTKNFDSNFLDALEELLYTSDLGPNTVTKLLQGVREKLSRGELSDLKTVKETLYGDILGILSHATVATPGGSNPWVILIVGVNGVGKTTSIGKLAHYYSSRNKSVLIIAGDTFRAAAEQQLTIWGERAKVEVYSSEQTKDAAAVAFQGIQKGLADKKEIIIVDTAGRLHTKENLMDELKKVKRVAEKALPGAPHEIILVVDANSGQNARIQAQQFNEALGLTSLIVTKLDGTARGGVIVGIADEVRIGVQFIGSGEKIDDLTPFSQEDYAKGLLRL